MYSVNERNVITVFLSSNFFLCGKKIIWYWLKCCFFSQNVPNTNARWPIKRSKDTEFCVVFSLGVGDNGQATWAKGPKPTPIMMLLTRNENRKSF